MSKKMEIARKEKDANERLSNIQYEITQTEQELRRLTSKVDFLFNSKKLEKFKYICYRQPSEVLIAFK